MTACYLCGSSLADALPVHDTGRTGPLRTVACRVCGMVQHAEHPTATELAHYYASGEYRREYPIMPTKGYLPGHAGYAEVRAAEGDMVAAQLLRDVDGLTSATVYEIGAGDCAVTLALRRAGVACHAVEPDTSVVPSGVTVLPALPDVLADPALVLARQVLEHMADPVRALRSWLRAGNVWVEVPNARRPYVSLTHFFQKPHVTTWTPETLACAALMAGADSVKAAESGTILVAALTGRGKRRAYAEARKFVDLPPAEGVVAGLHAWEANR